MPQRKKLEKNTNLYLPHSLTYRLCQRPSLSLLCSTPLSLVSVHDPSLRLCVSGRPTRHEEEYDVRLDVWTSGRLDSDSPRESPLTHQ
jgi:hypothetical protein